MILLACENSQTVTIEFRKLGYKAFSCDIEPCYGGHPEWHLQQNVIPLLKETCWKMIIAFPPCTYLCSSGLHWNKTRPGRKEKTEKALEFVRTILNAPCEHIGLENPVGCISSKIRKPGQYIQPYEFGDNASKKTGLWLKNLPLLIPTKYIEPRIVNSKKRWANQTDSGQNKLGPSEDRAKIRGKTYQGIARAMAEQWSQLL